VKTETSVKGKQAKCYKCREPGHIATHCKNPAAEKKTCFVCGSTEHLARNCPERKQDAVTEAKKISVQTTNVIAVEQNIELPKPYVVTLKISPSVKCDGIDTSSIDAVIDSDSPISLVRDSIVRDES